MSKLFDNRCSSCVDGEEPARNHLYVINIIDYFLMSGTSFELVTPAV
jgi:hypothetical protein